jgi:hypothetical protein
MMIDQHLMLHIISTFSTLEIVKFTKNYDEKIQKYH